MMAHHGETAIVRRFDTLNLKNILYLQAELIHLEAELHQMELDEKFAADPGSRPAHPFSVYDLREAASSGKATQWTKHQEIQSKLQAYNGAVIQYFALRKAAKPAASSIECLREWLDRPEGGDFFLKGREAEMWDTVEDLLSLDCPQPGKDALTTLINEKLVPWYHRRWGHRFQPSLTADWYGVWQYDQEMLETVANAITTLTASLLPSISIVVLYFLSKPFTRLVAMLLFSVLFSVILSAVSTVRRIEVFAATTA
ncbi:MAG: hypothetical protein Q9177_006442 [Variospora cf. flavescens]